MSACLTCSLKTPITESPLDNLLAHAAAFWHHPEIQIGSFTCHPKPFRRERASPSEVFAHSPIVFVYLIRLHSFSGRLFLSPVNLYEI
jgi:hypothetical protein